MENLLSALSVGPELVNLYDRLRVRASRQLLQGREVHQEDALANALQDGFLIFLRKLRTSTQVIRNPEVFAFEIIKRTFWDYRRRAIRREIPQDPAELIPRDIYYRPRFADGSSLFASLPEEHLWHWYQCLPELDQQLIDLRCLGYKDQEIAHLLHLSHGGVRNKFSKLIKAAKDCIRRNNWT